MDPNDERRVAYDDARQLDFFNNIHAEDSIEIVVDPPADASRRSLRNEPISLAEWRARRAANP
jgi:hypothetical protein